MRFVNTNVLLYAVSPAPGEQRKQEVAQQLLSEEALGLSVQVLQEFYHQATRSNRRGAISRDRATQFIDSIRHFPVQDMTLDIFRAGVALSQRYQLSYWDGAILAAAEALGCDILYTEDLTHGQDYGGVVVVNPFLEGRDP